MLCELWQWVGDDVNLCCRDFHAHGFFTRLREACHKRNIADIVANQLSLHWPALQARGVSHSSRLRIQAFALDWLDSFASARRFAMRFNQQVVAWALIRLGVKFELRQSISEKCYMLFGGASNDAVWQLECRVMMSMPRPGQ